MAYVWANAITTGGTITASAAIEIHTNLSAEFTARSTSYAWQYVTAITSGADIKANDMKEFRTAADAASAISGCTTENGSYDSTINANADASADGSQNTGVDSGNWSPYNSSEDSSVDGFADATVNANYHSTDDSTENFFENVGYDVSN